MAGKWTPPLDTQAGVQNDLYSLKAANAKLTGTAKSQFGESNCRKAPSRAETFCSSGGEIQFTRKVAGAATGELEAKREK